MSIGDTVRFSHLRAYGRSPMHGLMARQTEPFVTDAMQAGTALHSLILGGKPVKAYPGATRRGKEYDKFVEDNADTTILTASAYNKVQKMAEAVRDSPVAAPYLKGIHEQTLEFPWLGLNCRATPDVVGDGFITEVKTAMTSDPARFQWHALKLQYHAQMRMQREAVQQRTGKWLDCYIVCIESAAPYPVTVFKWTENALDAGEKTLALWAERLKGCEESKQWPGYAQSVVELDMPEDAEAGLVFGDEEEE